MKNLYKIENELYIVSSSEKIKENTQTHIQGFNGDWFYNTIYNFIARTGDITPYDFKIILTTNKLLIKDNVQAIDDEFLEWYVKNPSCEEVKVDKVDIEQPKPLYSNGNHKGERIWLESYKTIIPKETLEEAAKKLFGSLEKGIGADRRNIWMNGAKWQQERMYSDEEVLELLQKALTHKDNGETGNLITAQGEIRTANFYSWFEQNKKK
jgi:hypothetical protein